MTTRNQRLKKVLSDTPSAMWQEETKKRRQARPAYDRAFEIALLVMDVLEDKGWNQTRLASEMSMTRQAVSKILQGNRPINMPTIEKLEAALGVRIIEIAHRAEEVVIPAVTGLQAAISSGLIVFDKSLSAFASINIATELITAAPLSQSEITSAGNTQYAMAA